MSKFLDLGLGITIINVYYSLTYFLMWCVELQRNNVVDGTANGDEDDSEPFVWLAVYAGNLLLNIFLFLGLRKRDRLAIVIWFSLTLLWFVPKLLGHKRGCRLDHRGSLYRLMNVLLEIYVIISFVVMLLVYIYLPRRADRRQRKSTVRAVDNVDPMDIQMVELIDKATTGSVEPVTLTEQQLQQVESGECSVDQQVTHFDFHRADD